MNFVQRLFAQQQRVDPPQVHPLREEDEIAKYHRLIHETELRRRSLNTKGIDRETIRLEDERWAGRS